MDSNNRLSPTGSAATSPDREAALALACFLADYGWPLRVPTGRMTPRELWACPDDMLAGLLKLPQREIHRLRSFRKEFFAGPILENMKRDRIAVVILGEAAYPESLAQIHDPPPALFIRGGSLSSTPPSSQPLERLDAFMQRPRVAIVGARAASGYGIDAATKIARGLAAYGICIVSGMAFGIDAAAHRGSVEEPGGSVAVLGCGADVIYPGANRKLYAALISRGLVVSEYPPGTKPMPWRFPARNRIMAGLAEAVIVVEARRKSGALITADFCLEAGREVFAVPGSIFSELSAGPHGLIRSGAVAVTGAEDVLESLGIEISHKRLPVEADTEPAGLTDEEGRLLKALDGRSRHQDRLAARADVDGARAGALLVSLELRGLIRFDPGRGYSR